MKNFKKISKKYLVLLPALLLTKGASAQVRFKNPLASDTLPELVTQIVNFLIVISAPVVSIMVLWGGFQILTAGGEEEKYQQGKKTILYAVVGFIILLLSSGAATLIQNILGADSSSTCPSGMEYNSSTRSCQCAYGFRYQSSTNTCVYGGGGL